jgi:hypothetical protein
LNLYVSKTGNLLNGKTLDTELLSNSICLSPVYKGAALKNKNINILMDSGAFQDTDKSKRISFEDALARQLKYETKLGIVSQRIVAYDYIGNTNETIKANNFLLSKRNELRPRQLVLMIQGTTPEEYLECINKISKIVSSEDCIGFGGIAMASRSKKIREKLFYALKFGLPTLLEKGIKDVHLFGIGSFWVLEEINNIIKELGFQGKFNVSVDTSSLEVGSVMGKRINVENHKFEKIFSREQKYIDYHPRDLFHENLVKAIKIVSEIN